VYGGTGISEQIAELKRGAEIIVCTPGRMIDLLSANSGGSCLHSNNILTLLFEICQVTQSFMLKQGVLFFFVAVFHFYMFLIITAVSLFKT
jgi:hypothetical protein